MMTPEEIKTIIRSWYEKPATSEEFYSYFSPDVVFHRPPFAEVKGVGANRQQDEAMANAFSDQKIIIQEIIVEGDTAVMRYIWEAVHSGTSPTFQLPPSGNTIRSYGCSVYHWKGGKVVEQWDYHDMLGILQQMGAMPSLI